jgi:hypothetical protein
VFGPVPIGVEGGVLDEQDGVGADALVELADADEGDL